MELINEGFTLLFTYHMYTFTDWMPSVKNRKVVGKFLIALAMANVALNLFFASKPNACRLSFKLKLFYKKR